MELRNIQHVYLVGIGGIGMSGLARYFHHLGCAVYGYDKTATDLTHALESEGMEVIYTDDAGLIPPVFQTPSESLLVIFTPAIPKDSAILRFLTIADLNFLSGRRCWG